MQTNLCYNYNIKDVKKFNNSRKKGDYFYEYISSKPKNPQDRIRKADKNIQKPRDKRSKLEPYNEKEINRINSEIHKNNVEIEIAKLELKQSKVEIDNSKKSINFNKNDNSKQLQVHAHYHSHKKETCKKRKK